ncbi:GNAT family N-acetyltransferase [Pontibacillus salicampi]|uniref:GNAT family N-acetyltransferase n=1 Tax=Pontibacillus salicampi TaxID=1449801 RepID=A0ABV6LKM9_9BACI
MEIINLTTKQQWRESFPIMKELRTHLTEKDYIADLEHMAQNGYSLVACVDNGEMQALAGFVTDRSFAWGNYVWVHDLVTSSTARSKGYGAYVLNYIEQWARGQGYEKVILSSGLQREQAHHFYEHKVDMKKKSYVFQKKL